MKTLAQHLNDQPAVVLSAMARLQGVETESLASNVLLETLLEVMVDADHMAAIWNDLTPEPRHALALLRAENNRVPVLVFQRRYGEIRRFGTGRLQQERPWLTPANTAEVLWYHGLMTRGYADTGEGLVECFAIPEEIVAVLPAGTAVSIEFSLDPLETEVDRDLFEEEGERFLEDFATLLMYVHNQPVRLDTEGDWPSADLEALGAQWLSAPQNPMENNAPGSRNALMLYLAQALDFLAVRDDFLVLHNSAVTKWLKMSRAAQAKQLFSTWKNSAEWNDLCRTPGLFCEEGNWRNDPRATRTVLLQRLQDCQVETPYRMRSLLDAIHAVIPDFQRPGGNYDNWYIKDSEGAYLRGFATWFKVEGSLIRYLWTGPLFWFGVTALNRAQDTWLLSGQGVSYLNQTTLPDPVAETEATQLVISEDFYIAVPSCGPIAMRFQVARFSNWESSWPGFRYRITQRALRRAAEAKITPDMIVRYLDEASGGQLPANVRQALVKFKP